MLQFEYSWQEILGTVKVLGASYTTDSNDRVVVSANINVNHGSNLAPAAIIIATYTTRGGLRVITGAHVIPNTYLSSGINEFPTNITEQSGDEVALFIWDNLTDMNPLHCRIWAERETQ